MMKRRQFVKNTTMAMMSYPFIQGNIMRHPFKKEKIINAYYLRGQIWTQVPAQVRQDFEWMRKNGSNAVSIAVAESDFISSKKNIRFLIHEGHKAGLQVFAIPSRWAGLFAGMPKAPSFFSVRNPHTWILDEDGNPRYNNYSGITSSIMYPETLSYIQEKITEMLDLWPFDGIIWDEPKCFVRDFSPEAKKTLGENVPYSAYLEKVTAFLTYINQFIKHNHENVSTHLFGYASLSEEEINALGKVECLDYLGCDGRPWSREQDLELGGDGKGKYLLTDGHRFIIAARKNDMNSLWLVENHRVNGDFQEIMDQNYPAILAEDIDHLIYYYYPNELEDPDKHMNIISHHISTLRKDISALDTRVI